MTDLIRIAFCIDNMGIGGTELNAVRTAEHLDQRRFRLHVVTLQSEGPLQARYEQAGIPVQSFPISNLYGPSTISQGMRLARWLGQERIDIFHSQDVYSNIFGSAWARLGGSRAIVQSRRWWDSLPRQSLRLANRLAYRWGDVVVANSPLVAQLVERVDGVPAQRIVVVPNFVDASAFEPLDSGVRTDLRKKFGLPSDVLVVGSIARLSPVKDHATLLRAASMLRPRWPDVWYLLVGAGECREDLEREARRLGLEDRVVFTGMQPHRPNLHHLLDISVLCSRNEAFPNTVIEAMAAATPVVATAVGGVRDAVTDGVTGSLVPPSDPVRLAAKLQVLLEQPQLRRRLGETGQVRARERYTSAVALSALEGLYERLVS